MGYTTEFKGYFKLDRKLDDRTYNELINLHETRHSYETHPSIWCQWIPTYDKKAIMWDNVEKFYNYTKWLQYIIDNYLKPNNYVLNGRVFYSGERMGDCGYINVKDNKIVSEKLDIPQDYS